MNTDDITDGDIIIESDSFTTPTEWLLLSPDGGMRLENGEPVELGLGQLQAMDLEGRLVSLERRQDGCVRYEVTSARGGPELRQVSWACIGLVWNV